MVIVQIKHLDTDGSDPKDLSVSLLSEQGAPLREAQRVTPGGELALAVAAGARIEIKEVDQ